VSLLQVHDEVSEFIEESTVTNIGTEALLNFFTSREKAQKILIFGSQITDQKS
jgi:hypothetical protein